MGFMSVSRRSAGHLPDGAYDVRGWEVRTERDGEKVGTVDDMLLDERDRPRYLDVDLGFLRKHVLVPLSEAHADPSANTVWIERMDRDRLREVPEYDGDPALLSPAYEERLLEEYRLLSADGGSTAEGVPSPPSLARLGDLTDYRVAKGVTDPRGWKLVGGDGQQLGEVVELLVDPAGMTTRYLDCSVKEDKLGLEPLDRHVLVPAERARLDRKHKHVVVDGLFGRDVKDYPVYGGLPLDGAAEREIHQALERGGHTEGPHEPASDSRRFFGVRSRVEGDSLVRPRGRPESSSAETSSTPESDPDVDETRIEAPEEGEVRIRITSDDIVVEKHGRGSRDDG